MVEETEVEQACRRVLPRIIAHSRRYISDEKIIGEICEYCLQKSLEEKQKTTGLIMTVSASMRVYADRFITNYLTTTSKQ